MALHPVHIAENVYISTFYYSRGEDIELCPSRFLCSPSKDALDSYSRMIYTNVPLLFLLHSIYIYVVADSVQEKVRRLIEEHHEQINQVNDKYLPISCSKSSVIQPLITFEINDCKTNFYNFRLSMRLKMYSQFLALFLFSSLNDNKCEFDRRICVGEYILNSPTNTDKRSETSKTLK